MSIEEQEAIGRALYQALMGLARDGRCWCGGASPHAAGCVAAQTALERYEATHRWQGTSIAAKGV